MTAAIDETLECPELGAVVRLGEVDRALLDELPALYGSLFSTAAWFSTYDRKAPSGVCHLEAPHHVLVFCVEGDTVEILNKAFPITPRDTRRACLAIFQALPGARRIHLEVLFPPGDLRAPKRVLAAADDLVIDLPDDPAGYPASLGKRTRKNLRNFENRLRREYPDVVTTVSVPTAEELPALSGQLVDWNVARLRARGVVSGFVKFPDRPRKLLDLLTLGGAEAHVTRIEGRPAAIEFVFYVGDEATVYAGAFDAAFEDVHLGFLSTYWAIVEISRRGSRRCHLLWTTGAYKQRLGATPRTATQLSLFRTPAARLWSLGEAGEVVRRELRTSSRRWYWEARHAARKAAERVLAAAHPGVNGSTAR